jgi:murein L,D-transpeptidase YafK
MLRFAFALAVAVSMMLGSLASPASAQSSSGGLTGARARLRAAAEDAGVAYPLRNPSVRIYKSARVLVLYAGDAPVRAYWVGLGFNPFGHKQREGDGRTPEGEYYLCSRNDASRFHRFLGISYPSPRDAATALAEGRISERTAAPILRVRKPNRPPWNTSLGGAVGIHGGGAGVDWTLGCVALSNANVDELWVACPAGTRITILP